MSRGADVRVKAGSATVTVPADTTFTLTGGATGQAQPSSGVRFSRIRYDSPGRDTGSNASLDAEWARISNHRNTAKSLTGWTVRDRQGHVYRFGSFRLRPGKSVTLHTGRGKNTAADLYWGRSRYVWGNNGDKAILKNKARTTLDTCTWGNGSGTIAC
jgi:hypothetical protein